MSIISISDLTEDDRIIFRLDSSNQILEGTVHEIAESKEYIQIKVLQEDCEEKFIWYSKAQLFILEKLPVWEQ